MVGLLDVNVLVALFVPEHEHHVAALNWFTTEGALRGWAMCVVSELGVIRVCAQLPGGGRLVTFDSAISQAGGDDVVCLVP